VAVPPVSTAPSASASASLTQAAPRWGAKNGRTYITPDADVHSGGTWKMIDAQGIRIGTFNEDLTVRVGK